MELPNTLTGPDIAENMRKVYEVAIRPESFAQAVVFAMSQPEELDVNEILFRPTLHEAPVILLRIRRKLVHWLLVEQAGASLSDVKAIASLIVLYFVHYTLYKQHASPGRFE